MICFRSVTDLFVTDSFVSYIISVCSSPETWEFIVPYFVSAWWFLPFSHGVSVMDFYDYFMWIIISVHTAWSHILWWLGECELLCASLAWLWSIIVVSVKVSPLVGALGIYYGLCRLLDHEDLFTAQMGYFMLMAIIIPVRIGIIINNIIVHPMTAQLCMSVSQTFSASLSCVANSMMGTLSLLNELCVFYHVPLLSRCSLLLAVFFLLWSLVETIKPSVVSMATPLSRFSVPSLVCIFSMVFIIILGLSLLPEAWTCLSLISDFEIFWPLNDNQSLVTVTNNFPLVNTSTLTSVVILSSIVTSPSSSMGSVSHLSTLSFSSTESTQLGPLSTTGNHMIESMLADINSQFGGHLPLDRLTPTALKGVQLLSSMVYQLEQSTFGDDHKLLAYLVEAAQNPITYKCHFDLNSNTLEPYVSYKLPLGRNFNDMAAVYGFFVPDGDDTHVSIGSAISCRDRVARHWRNFKPHNAERPLHSFVVEHGLLSKVTWSPLISCPKLVELFYINYPTAHLSEGAVNTLRGFAQFPLRVLEQAMMDKYSPSLSHTSDVLSFNFAVTVEDFTRSDGMPHIYQAVDAHTGVVRASASSKRQLAPLLGVSNVTVANNMNWHQPSMYNIGGESYLCHLREEGMPMVTEPTGVKLPAKVSNPLVNLGPGRTIFDLEPGKLYAITPSFEDFGTYDNERQLWSAVNPGEVNDLAIMGSKSKAYLNNRVGAYLNVARLNKTEMGSFYFCRHPDFLAGFGKKAEAFLIISIATGIGSLFPTLKGHGMDRSNIRRYLKTGTLYKGLYRFVYQSDLVAQIPRLKGVEHPVLTPMEVESLSQIKGR